MKFNLKILPSVLLGVSLCAQAEPYRGPLSSALGGTGVAGLPATESALLNPALVPVYKRSSLDVAYRDGYLQSGHHRTAMALGAIDNEKDIVMPGAFHYVKLRDTGRAEQPANGELLHVALGQQVNQLALGVSGYRVQYTLANHPRVTEWNYSIGGVYMFTTSIGVGYVLRNVAGVGSNVPRGLREDLEQAAGLLAALGENARLRLDISREERSNPRHKLTYAVGLETKTSDLFTFRFGYRYDDVSARRLWSGGLGFDGPRLQADYSYQKAQDRGAEALHSVDLRLPF